MTHNDSLSLAERLEQYAAGGALPMHMPGHKRNLTSAPCLASLGGWLDITEIDGFDDLHHAGGVLRDEMDRAAALWGAKRTLFLVNGSTCGLLAAIYALGSGGGRAIVARNCHKAVYHGLELCGLSPQWLRPEWCGPLRIWGSVSPAEVKQALEETPDARFVLLTSPTYEGILSDISAIAELCHARGVPLIVDEAHGAHLGLSGFPDGAVKQGADIAVQSAHKTLPSLTQTALLHLSGTLADEGAVERALNIFETSSPSYLLLASLSGCVRFLEGPDPFAPWRAGLAAFDRETARLKHLQIANHGRLAGVPWPGVFRWDESKIVLLASGGAWNGFALMDKLRRRFSIELEMALPHYALAMTGAGDTQESLTRFARALAELDRSGSGNVFVNIPGPPGPFPPARMSVREALSAPIERIRLFNIVTEAIDRRQLAGRISAQYLWTYPPGIPLVVPGEEFTEKLLETLDELASGGAELRSSPEEKTGMVRVVSQ